MYIKRKYVLLLVSAVAAGGMLLFAALYLNSSSPAATLPPQVITEEYIRSEIESSRSCLLPSDCVEIAAPCPFGCNVAVNKKHAERINALITQYEQSHERFCVYDCMNYEQLTCSFFKCTKK